MFGIVTLFVGLDTTRALLSYSAFHSSSPPSSSTIVLVSEIIKFVVALVALTLDKPDTSIYKPLASDPEDKGDSTTPSSRSDSLSSQDVDIEGQPQYAADVDASAALSDKAWMSLIGIHYALPALLYLVNQILFFLAVSLTSPSLTQAGIMAKLPFTGILHHFKVHRQRSWKVWVSLLFACVGLYLFTVYSPGGSGAGGDAGSKAAAAEAAQRRLGILALVIGLVISANSALASVYTEIMLKQEVRFWASQAYLYFWGMLFATVSIPFQKYIAAAETGPKSPPVSKKDSLLGAAASVDDNVLMLETLVILLTAISGLVVARILRVASNLDKMIGFLISLVTICFAQFFFYPELRAATLTPPKVIGCLVIVISTASYNYYKESPPPPPQAADGPKPRKGA